MKKIYDLRKTFTIYDFRFSILKPKIKKFKFENLKFIYPVGTCVKNIKFNVLTFPVFIFSLFFNVFCLSVFCFLYFFLFFAGALGEKMKVRGNLKLKIEKRKSENIFS